MQSIQVLQENISRFAAAKPRMLELWVSYDIAKDILKRHEIEPGFFMREYASGVYDYFELVIRAKREIGDCPVIADLLLYLKDHEISANELFLLCSHFRRAMIDVSYEIGINSKELFDEISYVFDLNFAGVLKRYTDTIYQKEREIERNVKLLEEYRRAIDESAIVSKTDAHGTITYANEKLSRVCGYTPEELVGSAHSIMRHPDMPDTFFADLWETITQNRVFKGTIKNRTKSGETFYVDTTIVPITDTANRITEYMAISYEVTDLVVAKEEAIAAGEAKEYFLSNMSHEIRTPLNAILGFVALLKDEVQSTKEKRYLDIIDNSGENLLSIINDILDFSKLRSGEFTVEPKTFNLHRAISHTLELFVPSVNQHQLTLTSFIDPRIPYELISDPLRIQQVISNLLSNAIKFTPPFGEIKVEASFFDDTITVSVSDTGIGIPPKEQEHIFDPFSQARGAAEVSHGGTGLGLSISAQLVRHMGGEITLDSKPGIGSTFSFTLPVTVGGENRPGLMDIAKVQKLRLALYVEHSGHDIMSESLERYLQSFGIGLSVIHDLSATFDLLFFSEHSVSEQTRTAIIADPRPAIALMDAPDEAYDAVAGVTPLVMPLYCAKLQEVMERALEGQSKAAMVPQVSQRTRLSGRVLVAEDNEANQELICILLENMGIDYDLVPNGAQALAKMKSQHYDAVLMDEQMPVMDGVSATKKMRRYESKSKRRHLPVIAITANVIGRHEHRNLYDGFVGKPVRTESLLAVLEPYLKVSDTDSQERETQERVPRTDIQVCGNRIDRALLCETLQIRPEQLERLLEVFRRKMDESFSQLEEAIDQQDWHRVMLVAHSVKGASGNFRIEELTETAEKMEKRARAGETQGYGETLSEMKRLFGELGL